MKKILLVMALVALGATVASAQVSIYSGYSLSKYTCKYNDANYSESSYSNNFFVGGIYNFSLAKGFGIETGACIYLGGKNEDSSKFRESRISLPVFLDYYIPIADNVSICPFGGFILDCGLFSKTTNTIGETSISTDWYKKTINRFDIAASLGFGFNFFKRYNIYLQASRGLLNTAKVNTFKQFRTGFEVGIGYSF